MANGDQLIGNIQFAPNYVNPSAHAAQGIPLNPTCQGLESLRENGILPRISHAGVYNFPKLDEFIANNVEKIKGAGTKLDEGKPDYFLIPPNALNEVVRALTYGAKEHDSDDLNQEPNWKSVKNLERRFYSAAQRHQNAYRRGEKIDSGDKGSNCHHLACAIVDLLFVLETELTKKETI